MSLKEFLSKTSIANIVAGFAYVVAVVYAFKTNNTDLMSFLAGAAIGYLFKRGEK